MNTPARTQRLLDDIEDAEQALTIYKRWRRLLVTVTLTGLGLVVTGITLGALGFTNGWSTAGAIVTGAIVFILAGLATMFFISEYHCWDTSEYGRKTPPDNSPQQVLIQAQRAYRDHLMEQP